MKCKRGAGIVKPGKDWMFRIDLDRRLAPGSYTMLAMVVVNGNTMNPDIKRIPVSVSGD